MTVKCLYHTPLWVCSEATRQCWNSRDKSDTNKEDPELYCGFGDELTGDKDKSLINRIGNQNKHKSVLEHLVYTFDIDGISRACLQEVARHRIASYSVKSTRYTLKELKDEVPFMFYDYDAAIFSSDACNRALRYIVLTNNPAVNDASIMALENLRKILASGVSNDVAKYCLPEAYKTSLTMTINARSLQNFLELRTSPHALWEIRFLAKYIAEVIPKEHFYLFEDSLNDAVKDY